MCDIRQVSALINEVSEYKSNTFEKDILEAVSLLSTTKLNLEMLDDVSD